MKKNEKGFGAVEGILILVIIALVGVVGFMVYKNHNKKVATTTSTATKAPTTDTKTTPATTPAKTTPEASKGNTYKISDLGIEITNIPSEISDLTDYEYTSYSRVDSNNSTTTPVKTIAVKFSTNTLTTADSACSAKNGTSIGMLARTDGTYVNNEQIDNTAFVKQFSGFYVTYSHPEASCSNNNSAEALHSSQTATFQNLVTNPDNLQAL